MKTRTIIWNGEERQQLVRGGDAEVPFHELPTGAKFMTPVTNGYDHVLGTESFEKVSETHAVKLPGSEYKPEEAGERVKFHDSEWVWTPSVEVTVGSTGLLKEVTL